MGLFFFSSRRRHTRSKRDWSSDVCSSDLSRFGGRMQRESKRLTQLVQEIIDLSRVQDHAAPATTEKISAAEVVDDARSEERRVGKEGRRVWRRQNERGIWLECVMSVE